MHFNNNHNYIQKYTFTYKIIIIMILNIILKKHFSFKQIILFIVTKKHKINFKNLFTVKNKIKMFNLNKRYLTINVIVYFPKSYCLNTSNFN